MTTRILVAEDSAAMRAFIVSALEVVGDCEVIEASSGFEAIKQLPARKFDLIITDINMPDINGLELISFIKNNENYRTIPVLVVTTEGRAKDREKGLALGADEYMIKPLDTEILAKTVKKLTGVE